MAKRGRKPKNQNKNYFVEAQEDAVRDYLLQSQISTDSTYKLLEIILGYTRDIIQEMIKDEKCTLYDLLKEAELLEGSIKDEDDIDEIRRLKEAIKSAEDKKNVIYNETLKPAFEKMVESIIRRYHLYIPEESFEDTFRDTLSFLITKTDKFDGKRQKKAYSYYGNVCKNYLIGRNQNYLKNSQRNPSYDIEEEEFTNNIRYTNKTDRNEKIAIATVEKFIKRIDNMIKNPSDFSLKDSEVKLGEALKNLLENWDFVISTDGSNKLNKNAILMFLREQTGLDTKGVRVNMRRYKKEYLIVKDSIIN